MKNDSRSGAGHEADHESSRTPRLTIHRCENSHAFFFPHETCPFCAGRLSIIDVPPDARLLSQTVVRVSPTGTPFGLGLARLSCGAQTLCIIEGGAVAEVDAEVVVVKRGALYYAERMRAG